jgi:CRISPR-associated protein Csb2
VTALCEDVSCLGEADSPVLLTVDQVDTWEPSHDLDTNQSGFPLPGGVRVRTPVEGRVEELELQHREANPTRSPSKASDRHSWSVQPGSHQPATGAVRDFIYRPVAPATAIPWPQVLLIDIDGDVDSTMSVPWSVAFHRAIAARLPEPAPSLITGVYPPGSQPPANRIAIHLLPATPVTAQPLERPAFAILVPVDATSEDLAALQAALRGMRRIHSRLGQLRLLGEPRPVSARDFWCRPAAGYTRFHRPLPALVPEVRRQRSRDSRRWTLSDAAALSVAYVFRDRFRSTLQRSDAHFEAVRVVAESGFAIHEVHAIRDSRVDRFAHKTPQGVVVQPYTGLVDLAGLAPPTALIALGQSRHLGGGLLFPEDLLAPVARARGLVS